MFEFVLLQPLDKKIIDHFAEAALGHDGFLGVINHVLENSFDLELAHGHASGCAFDTIDFRAILQSTYTITVTRRRVELQLRAEFGSVSL